MNNIGFDTYQDGVVITPKPATQKSQANNMLRQRAGYVNRKQQRLTERKEKLEEKSRKRYKDFHNKNGVALYKDIPEAQGGGKV